MTNFIEQPPLSDPAPLLLGRLKQQLKILDNTRDSELLGWLSISIDLIERYTWRVIRERLIIGQFSSFISSRIENNECAEVLDFRRTPVNELEQVVYKASAGDEVLDAHFTIVDSYAEITLDSEPAIIDSEKEYPLEATCNCGYKIVSGVWSCPDPIQQAIIAMAAWAYSNPSDCGTAGCTCSGSASNGIKLPNEVALFLMPYVIRRFD